MKGKRLLLQVTEYPLRTHRKQQLFCAFGDDHAQGNRCPTNRLAFYATGTVLCVVLRGRDWAAELTNAAQGSPEASEAFDRIAALVSRLLGSEVGLVSLVEADRQFFLGQHGLPEPWSESRQTPLSQSICQMVVTSGTPVQIDDTVADERTLAHDARTVLDVGSYLGVPLFDDNGLALGSLCAIDHRPHAWSGADLDLLVQLSAAARSEMRARVALAVAEQATLGVRVLADASELLSRTLDVDATLEAMLGIVAPTLASASAIYLPHSSHEARRVVVGRAQQGRAGLFGLPQNLERILACEPVQSVLNGSSSERRIPRQTLEGPSGDSEAELLVIPLTSHQDILGVWLIESDRVTEHLDPLKVTLLADLARRGAATLRNAFAFGRERDVSLRLQHDLLGDLPDIDGLDACAIYEPSAVGLEVGGDWYDLAVTPSGAVLATLGDVTGHDLQAAAAMGRLTAAIRCYGHDGLSPVRILGRLDGFSDQLLGDGLYATGVCLRLSAISDRTGWNLELTNAGHPPPLLIPKEGDPRLLQARSEPLLGMGQPTRTALRTHLEEGDILILYSDGLIEHRNEHPDSAVSRLLTIANSLDATGPIDDYCRKLLVEATPSHEDDIAVLVLRPTASSRPATPPTR
jgi:GAF domain-containing protein